MVSATKAIFNELWFCIDLLLSKPASAKLFQKLRGSPLFPSGLGRVVTLDTVNDSLGLVASGGDVLGLQEIGEQKVRSEILGMDPHGALEQLPGPGPVAG